MSSSPYLVAVCETLVVGPKDPYAISDAPRLVAEEARVVQSVVEIEDEETARLVAESLNANSQDGEYPAQPIFTYLPVSEVPPHDHLRWSAKFSDLDAGFRSAASTHRNERVAMYRFDALVMVKQAGLAEEVVIKPEEVSTVCPSVLTGDKPDNQGYVERPIDPGDYVPVKKLLELEEVRCLVRTSDHLNKILNSNPQIRRTRYQPKTGKSHPKRCSVHLADFYRWMDSLAGGPALTDAEIEERINAHKSKQSSRDEKDDQIERNAG